MSKKVWKALLNRLELRLIQMVDVFSILILDGITIVGGGNLVVYVARKSPIADSLYVAAASHIADAFFLIMFAVWSFQHLWDLWKMWYPRERRIEPRPLETAGQR